MVVIGTPVYYSGLFIQIMIVMLVKARGDLLKPDRICQKPDLSSSKYRILKKKKYIGKKEQKWNKNIENPICLLNGFRERGEREEDKDMK